MRVLMTCDALRPPMRGVGRVCETLLPALVAQGDLVVPLVDGALPRAAELAGQPCHVLPAARSGPARTARWYATLLARLAAARDTPAHDVLLSTAGFPHVFGRHARLCVFVHDLHMLSGRGAYQLGKRAWFRAFLRRSLARAGLRICVSAHTKRELERSFPELDPAHNVVVHNAVPSFETPAGTSKVRSDGEHFLFVGQLERRKNVLALLEAYAAARDDGVRAPLHLVGRMGQGADQIVARARALGDVVQVHTDVDDVELRSMYTKARALLLPSSHEGFGLPIVEAMRAGVPVLTSMGTALEEVAGGAALLVEPSDIADIRRGIVALDGSRELRTELATRGLSRGLDFSPAEQARQLRQAIAARWPEP